MSLYYLLAGVSWFLSLVESQEIFASILSGDDQQQSIAVQANLPDHGVAWPFEFQAGKAISEDWTPRNTIKVEFERRHTRIEYPLTYYGPLYNKFEKIQTVPTGQCTGCTNTFCCCNTDPPSPLHKVMHNFTVDTVHNVTYDAWKIHSPSLKYVIAVTITQNEEKTEIILDPESTPRVAYPPDNPFLTAIINTNSTAGGAFLYLNDLYLAVARTTAQHPDHKSFLVPEYSVQHDNVNQLGISAQTFVSNFRCEQPPGYLVTIRTASVPNPDPYNQFEAYENDKLITRYSKEECVHNGEWTKTDPLQPTGQKVAVTCPHSSNVNVAIRLATTKFRVKLLVGVPIVLETGVYPLERSSPTVYLYAVITNQGESAARFHTQITKCCFSNDMDVEECKPDLSGIKTQTLYTKGYDTRTHQFVFWASDLLHKRGYCTMELWQNGKMDSTTEINVSGLEYPPIIEETQQDCGPNQTKDPQSGRCIGRCTAPSDRPGCEDQPCSTPDQEYIAATKECVPLTNTKCKVKYYHRKPFFNSETLLCEAPKVCHVPKILSDTNSCVLPEDIGTTDNGGDQTQIGDDKGDSTNSEQPDLDDSDNDNDDDVHVADLPILHNVDLHFANLIGAVINDTNCVHGTIITEGTACECDEGWMTRPNQDPTQPADFLHCDQATPDPIITTPVGFPKNIIAFVKNFVSSSPTGIALICFLVLVWCVCGTFCCCRQDKYERSCGHRAFLCVLYPCCCCCTPILYNKCCAREKDKGSGKQKHNHKSSKKKKTQEMRNVMSAPSIATMSSTSDEEISPSNKTRSWKYKYKKPRAPRVTASSNPPTPPVAATRGGSRHKRKKNKGKAPVADDTLQVDDVDSVTSDEEITDEIPPPKPDFVAMMKLEERLQVQHETGPVQGAKVNRTTLISLDGTDQV